jgi:hypothetical protein
MARGLVGGDVDQSIAQRIQRMTDKAAKKGITFSPEELAKKREESKLVADSWHPGMEKFKKLPHVIQYNHTEHEIEPLIKKLQGLLHKKAADRPGLWDNIRAKRARGEKPAKPGDKDYPDKEQWDKLSKESAASPAWQRSEGKNPEGGLNAKGRASYKRETGGTLKAPVTESNPKGERARRQNSFCSRMCGMKRVNTGSKAKNDPDSRINKSLRKWNCKCGEDHESLYEKIACLVKESKGRCWEGYEPVPGKEPYSEDSCRPKGEKKKEKLEKSSSTDTPYSQPTVENPYPGILGDAGVNAAEGLVLYGANKNNNPVQIQQPLAKNGAADHELKSSNIKAVGYNKDTKSLEVEFHSGGSYTYKDVPKSLFERIKKVKSPGKFFHKHVKKDAKYDYSKLEKEAAKKIPKLQQLLPGMEEWVKKQPFNHAEELFRQGKITAAHRDKWVSGRMAEEFRPKFEEMMRILREGPPTK